VFWPDLARSRTHGAWNSTMARSQDLLFFLAIAAISFLAYATASYGLARLFALPPRRCVMIGVLLPIALFAAAWIVEQIAPMSRHDAPGGFIRLNLGWHHLWLAPGFLLLRWIR
jgi:hypothetical protein